MFLYHWIIIGPYNFGRKSYGKCHGGGGLPRFCHRILSLEDLPQLQSKLQLQLDQELHACREMQDDWEPQEDWGMDALEDPEHDFRQVPGMIND